MSVSPGKFLLFLIIVVCHPVVGQDGGDLIKWYQGFFFEGTQKNAEAGIAAARSALNKAIQADNLDGQAKALNEIGLIYLTRTHNYEEAMNFFIQALTLEDSLDLEKQKIFTYLAIAQVFEEVGDYLKALDFLEDALHLSEDQRSSAVRVLILNKSGRVSALVNRIEDAFQYYQQVLNLKDEGAPEVEAEALFNLAHLYGMQGKYDQSLDYHKQALAIRRKLGDKKNEAVSLNDIGEVYRLMGNFEKALANHVVALELRHTLKDKASVAKSYNNIGALYYQQKNIERAIANLDLALQAGKESQSQDQIGVSYDYLHQCYKTLGDYKKALEYKESFLTIHDFIQNEKNEHRILESQSRYVIEQQESRIGKLESDRIQRERELLAQKQLRNLLITVMAFGLIIILLTLYLYILKRRSNKVLQAANARVQQQNVQLQNLNATKDKFFSIISHDLKGPLNSLTSFSGLLINHTDSLSKEEIQMLAKDLDKSLKNLFALLENLLEWSRSQTGNIDFKGEKVEISQLLELNKELLQAQAQNKKISIEFKNEDPLFVNAHKHSVNTIIRNLISNAIKFTPEGGVVSLGIRKLPEKNEVVVSIADTGVGMSKDVIQKLFRIDTKHTTKGTADEKGTGLGLILCKDFIEKNGGRIGVESEPGKGSVFYFVLPLHSGAPDAPEIMGLNGDEYKNSK